MLRIGTRFASGQPPTPRGFDLRAAREPRLEGPASRVGFQLIQQRSDAGSTSGTGQLRREFITARGSEPCVFVRVDARGVVQDLLRELFRGAVRGSRRIRLDPGPVHGDESCLHKSGASAQPKDLTEQLAERVFMRGSETSDRGVIGKLVRRDHTKRDVFTATTFDHPTRPLTNAIRVHEQRHHHRRLIRRATATIRPIRGHERRHVELPDDIQHKPGQMIRREPFRQRRRHQQQLIAIARHEVVSHNP